ncbi:ribonuclease H-like domain-containing protein [Lenzites betulinus]|nr:ribonuclease H-like domain-containing protein [Lenzites betulinus]
MAQKYPVPPPDKFLALATTSVGCGPGGGTPMIARVALVDYRGQTVFSTYVLPTNQVTDYRTHTTGIQPADLQPGNAMPWKDVQDRVALLIRDKILVGHSLWQDLSVLGIPHPAVATRDVALYQPFRIALRFSPNSVIGLPTLMWQLMRRKVQEPHVCALETARATLDLYRSHATEWEGTISRGQWPSFLPPSTFSKCYL